MPLRFLSWSNPELRPTCSPFANDEMVMQIILLACVGGVLHHHFITDGLVQLKNSRGIDPFIKIFAIFI